MSLTYKPAKRQLLEFVTMFALMTIITMISLLSPALNASSGGSFIANMFLTVLYLFINATLLIITAYKVKQFLLRLFLYIEIIALNILANNLAWNSLNIDSTSIEIANYAFTRGFFYCVSASLFILFLLAVLQSLENSDLSKEKKVTYWVTEIMGLMTVIAIMLLPMFNFHSVAWVIVMITVILLATSAIIMLVIWLNSLPVGIELKKNVSTSKDDKIESKEKENI